MVEAIRKLVSGNRRRFIDDQFSLDLTYIIPDRLVAMSYPSSGFESLYRNSIDKVSKNQKTITTLPTQRLLRPICQLKLDDLFDFSLDIIAFVSV